MKFSKFCLTIIIMLSCLMCFGCDNKQLLQPKIERDVYNTGGKLSFTYDELSHTATFGGEGEVIQFYQEDIAKGWQEKGCRIGFQILVPAGVKDYKTGRAVLNGEKLTSDDFILKYMNQTLIALFQPIVNEEQTNLTLKITWEEGKNDQVYHILIKPGTVFMDEKAK